MRRRVKVLGFVLGGIGMVFVIGCDKKDDNGKKGKVSLVIKKAS